jgi:putative PIN family toxin of toxin-antitoxin system
VLISAILDSRSSSSQALMKARSQGRLTVSNEIISEYLSVFSRRKFDKWISYETRISFIENIIENALLINVTRQITACRDKKDDMFLSLAASIRANSIVSKDKDLLVLHPFNGTPILVPADFLNFDF